MNAFEFDSVVIGFIGSAISVVVGIFINSVFTWKIKDQVDAMDNLTKTLWEIHHIYINSYELRKDNPDKKISEYSPEDKDKLKRNRYKYNELIGVTSACNQILNNKFYDGLEEYTLNVGKIFKNEIRIEDINTKSVVFSDVAAHRKKVTSFCYMLTQLNPRIEFCDD